MIRLVATDLDGTLLTPEQTVTARTRNALERVHALGITVVLVTARPIHRARLIAKEAGMSGLAIVSNGAITIDLDKDPVSDPSAILEHVTIAPEVLLEFVQALRAVVSDVTYKLVSGIESYPETHYHWLACRDGNGTPQDEPTAIMNALEFAQIPATKLIARSEQHKPDALLKIAQGLNITGLELTHSHAPFIEIAAAGITKARTLEKLCQSRGIPREAVVAFGDAPNDRPMLEWAGHGVAMSNAHANLLEIANEVTLSNLEDGVAVWLEKNLLASALGFTHLEPA
jgi:Cof subfamily protein (haloacid dehalogenase superfamily)